MESGDNLARDGCKQTSHFVGGYSIAWQRYYDMVMVCPYIMTWSDGDGIMTW